MKRSTLVILLILVLAGLGSLFFTPLRTKVRSKLVRVWSKNAVALKTDRQVSEAAYAWPLTDSDGNSHAFEKERGQVVFLNFWATWCAPCIKEMPDIQKLYDRYGDRVSFLLVTQEDSEKVRTFIQKKGFSVPMYLTEKAEIPSAFYSSTIPTSYIIDHTGTIRMAKSGAIDIKTDAINSVFDELILRASR